jgi:hypothetical protein
MSEQERAILAKWQARWERVVLGSGAVTAKLDIRWADGSEGVRGDSIGQADGSQVCAHSPSLHPPPSTTTRTIAHS